MDFSLVLYVAFASLYRSVGGSVYVNCVGDHSIQYILGKGDRTAATESGSGNQRQRVRRVAGDNENSDYSDILRNFSILLRDSECNTGDTTYYGNCVYVGNCAVGYLTDVSSAFGARGTQTYSIYGGPFFTDALAIGGSSIFVFYCHLDTSDVAMFDDRFVGFLSGGVEQYGGATAPPLVRCQLFYQAFTLYRDDVILFGYFRGKGN